MTSANKSLAKKNFPSGWKFFNVHTFIEIWSTWEVWRALKKLELLSPTPRATLTHLSCSPNFRRASYLDERTQTYEPIVKYICMYRHIYIYTFYFWPIFVIISKFLNNLLISKSDNFRKFERDFFIGNESLWKLKSSVYDHQPYQKFKKKCFWFLSH